MNYSAIQSHLYNSLLTGQTSDICIRITGAFDATYHLHRVVLIQAGFWRDLFTGGFIESSAKRQTTGFKSGTRIDSHNSLSSFGAGILDVVLDDRNISRAAFELSISRLYGGGPPLYIHSSLLPTSTHPLTFGFPYQPVFPLSSSLLYPPGYQPATPEFLISLLATSIYLSIPSLASEALTGILKTIGPRTVVYYLRFALGRSRLKESADCSAVGLEGLADVDIDRTVFPQSTNIPVENRNSSVGDDTPFLSASHTATNNDSHLSKYTGSPSSHLPFSYGPISDKIGEACACWLARWGADMFVDEEKVVSEWLNDPSASLESWTSKEERALDNPPLSSNTDSNESSLPTTSTWSPKWSRSTEGLSLSWIQALISSDDFFVPAPSLYASEERYALAKRVVELRRAVRSKCREEDAQWDVFFRTSIYYMNMSSEAVIKISKDISHSTGRAYVDLRTLQEAAWEAGLTKSMITGGNSNDTFLLNTTDKVGLTKTVSDTLSTLSSDNSFDNAKPYFIIPANESLRIGDTITSSGGVHMEGNIHNNVTMDELFANNDHAGERSKPEKIAPIAKTSNEQTFFGLRGNICHVNRTKDADLPPSQLLSAHPPLRFSVEFFNLEMLKEKDRLHSRTVWFAGSLWNVYVQIVKRKEKSNSANSVYLHRQSPTENIPPFSAPDPFAGTRWSSKPHSDPTPSPRSPAFSPLTAYASAPQGASSSVTTSHSPSPSSRLRGNSASSPATPSSHPSTAPGSPSPSGRPLVSVYFSINCASPTGGTQIRFRSAPDVFKVGQSWGWKSSGLLGEIQGSASTNVSNTDGDFEAALVELDRNSPPVGTEVSFRATVVLGIV
ncbi:hypothetical protein GGU11DRAFT_672467 [Lentinula aff. detonsa]|nr:hypothetical protein GGU11DRAFT_672467 [Lentinula aff. detonsa]